MYKVIIAISREFGRGEDRFALYNKNIIVMPAKLKTAYMT
jgi:hypothetical protein